MLLDCYRDFESTIYLHSLEEGNKFENNRAPRIIFRVITVSRLNGIYFETNILSNISLSRNVYIRVDTGCFSRKSHGKQCHYVVQIPRGDNFTFACTIIRKATVNLANTTPF